MAFDFPNSPIEGQIYGPVGGPIYIYTNGLWMNTASGSSVVAIVSDNVPSSPSAGQLWWESDTGNLYLYYNDGTSSQWVQVNAPISILGTAESRNRIVNPAMQISQELGDTGGAVSSAAFYVVDQWYAASMLASCVAVRDPNTKTPNGSKSVLSYITTSKPSLAAGDYWYITQPIEGIRVADFLWGATGARQAVLAFWVQGNYPGTYTVAIRNAATDRSFLASFPVTASWTRISIVIPGDTTGTWPITAALGLTVTFSFASGTTYQGTAGWQAGNKLSITGTTNAAVGSSPGFYISDVGLYLDPRNTGIAPLWVTSDEAQELAACQRYWQQAQLYWCGSVTSLSGFYASTTLQVVARTSAAVLSGVNLGNGGFAATVGTLSMLGVNAIRETRTATATGAAQLWGSTLTCNARM